MGIDAAGGPEEAPKRLARDTSPRPAAAHGRLPISTFPAPSSRHTLTGPVGWIWKRTRVGAAAFLSSFFFFLLSLPTAAGVGVGCTDCSSPGEPPPHCPI